MDSEDIARTRVYLTLNMQNLVQESGIRLSTKRLGIDPRHLKQLPEGSEDKKIKINRTGNKECSDMSLLPPIAITQWRSQPKNLVGAKKFGGPKCLILGK